MFIIATNVSKPKGSIRRKGNNEDVQKISESKGLRGKFTLHSHSKFNYMKKQIYCKYMQSIFIKHF